MDRTLTKNSLQVPLQLKGGMFSLMTLELTTTVESLLLLQLEQLHQQIPGLFKNTPVVLTLNQLSEKEAFVNFDQIKLLCSQFNINVIAVKGGTLQQQQAAINAGLAVFPDSKKKLAQEKQNARLTRVEIPIDSESSDSRPLVKEEVSNTLIVDTPVRSGQQIYHSGDIIITAPVNTGAEILATGNIHIYGTLRGRTLAGVNGNKEARIFCQQFEAELISVAGNFKSITSTDNQTWQKTVQIYLQDDHLKFKVLP